MPTRDSCGSVTTPRKDFTPSGDYATCRGVMAGCAIAVRPLAPTRFTSMKSDIKAVEAASHRLCCLASPTVYEDSIRDGETGVILPDPAALLAALRGFIANPDAARAMAAAAAAAAEAVTVSVTPITPPPQRNVVCV